VAFQTEDAKRLRYGPFTTDQEVDVGLFFGCEFIEIDKFVEFFQFFRMQA
jgi:hypothetical protein